MLDKLKKMFFPLILCLCLSFAVFSQDQTVDPFAEWLVQLVYDSYPGLQVLNSEMKITEEEIKLARKEWLNASSFNLGFNRTPDFNDPAQPDPNNNFLFPRISVGASLRLYPLFATKNKVRSAEAGKEAQVYNIDVERSVLRREVLTRYRDYQLALDLLKVRSKMEEDADAHYRLLDRLFRSNEAEFKDYNDAYKTHQAAIEARLEAEANIDKARISLEELIGISLVEARRQWANRG